MRRVQKRIAEVGVETYSDYIDHLEVHPDEFQPLFNTVLINVTGFFRDAAAWDYIRDDVLPRILAERRNEQPIRVCGRRAVAGPLRRRAPAHPVESLAGPLPACLDGEGEQSVELAGVNRRGKPILCRINCTALQGTQGAGKVLLLMEERSVA
jgi:hypothetical protein